MLLCDAYMINGDAIFFIFGFAVGIALLWLVARIVLAGRGVVRAVDRKQVRN